MTHRSEPRRLPGTQHDVGRGQPLLRLGYDHPLGYDYHETIIYEAHVKGLTQQHPGVPGVARHCLGIWEPAVIERLLDLGVTALELMPVHQFVIEYSLVEGPEQLLGLQHDQVLRPHNGIRRHGHLR